MRLRRSDCHAPGILRRRRGRGFSYQWATGEAVTDGDVLARIDALVIPPAWTDVWICPWPHGHIQAVGTDKAGRRQYRYHDAWRVLRDRQKFDRVLEFGRALPDLRRVVEGDLSSDGMTEARVLAAAVRLLDLGFFRIGGEQYAQEHETFGIATLRRSHVRLEEDRMVFDYPAKGSIRRIVTISDPDVLSLVRVLKRRRGGDGKLLAYEVDDSWSSVHSEDINAYIRQAAGGPYTAKDFRTWSATVLAGAELALLSAKAPLSKTARARAASRAVKTVAEYLGNTPAVCRRSYIDPKVVDRFFANETVASTLYKLGTAPDFDDWAVREVIEAAIIELIAEGSGGTKEGAA